MIEKGTKVIINNPSIPVQFGTVVQRWPGFVSDVSEKYYIVEESNGHSTWILTTNELVIIR